MSQYRLQTYYMYLVYVAMTILFGCSLLARFRILNDTLCSLSALILPIVYLVVFILILSTFFLRNYKDYFFTLLLIFILIPTLLWPPLWLLRTPRVAKRVEKQVVRVSTWNVARMGELALKDKKAKRQARLKCVQNTLNKTQSDLFAIQEISKSRVRDLESSMSLTCKHVDYYGTGYGHRGGLAICSNYGGDWKINFARNFQLPGRWRALFAEVENRAVIPSMRLNLLNIHFLPHKISPRTIKNAVYEDLADGSIQKSVNLLKQTIQTTRKQEEQAEALMQVIQTFVDPTVIVGDFNSPAHSKLHWVLGQDWVDTWKKAGGDFGATRYFAGWLPFRVDFIYTHRQSFDVLSSFVQKSNCSDHQTLITDMRFLDN